MPSSDYNHIAKTLVRRYSPTRMSSRRMYSIAGAEVSFSPVAANYFTLTNIKKFSNIPSLVVAYDFLNTRTFASSPRSRDDDTKNHDLIPGTDFRHTSYGSLGDPTCNINNSISGNHINRADSSNYSHDKDSVPTSWQPQNDADIQHVTSQALIYELTRTTAKTIEKVVPWFLNIMPESYFRQIPPYLRHEHVKALTAIADADMDLYLNLKSKTSDGRTVYTFIRPTTKPGTCVRYL